MKRNLKRKETKRREEKRKINKANTKTTITKNTNKDILVDFVWAVQPTAGVPALHGFASEHRP